MIPLPLLSDIRLLAFVIAPSIGMKHCLSMTGYSFFSWNLALLCSYPLELYKEDIAIPLSLPLMIFCIPSSLALVCLCIIHCVTVCRVCMFLIFVTSLS